MKIALVGSMVFLDRINKIKSDLEKMGHICFAPEFTEEELASGADTFMDYVESHGGVEKVAPEHEIWKIKEEAIRSFKPKMDECDAMLVCNFDKGEKKNRIGDNTFLEMGYMFLISKKLFVLNGPPYGDDKIEEVLGMRPTFLHGDLVLIDRQ
jgi:hypothetical protein